jgi:hypothetical protein
MENGSGVRRRAASTAPGSSDGNRGSNTERCLDADSHQSGNGEIGRQRDERTAEMLDLMLVMVLAGQQRKVARGAIAHLSPCTLCLSLKNTLCPHYGT